MRLIDADALKIKVEAMVEHKVLESDYDYGCNQTLDYVADILIDNAPTIDAEPIVRCKECMYFKKWAIDFTGDTIELNSCSYNNHGMNEDGYCSRGKRREP